MNSVIVLFLGLILGAVVIAVFGLIMAIPIMYLWNWIMPDLFDLKTITYLQAWGVFFLAGLLIKFNETW